MPVGVFIDTSALVAWASDRDEHHVDAQAEFNRLLDEHHRFVLTTDVFDETITMLLGRRGHRAAAALGDFLRSGEPFRITNIDTAMREDAWKLFHRYADNPISHTDCTSVIAMRRIGLAEVFAFDSDFDRAGVVRIPR